VIGTVGFDANRYHEMQQLVPVRVRVAAVLAGLLIIGLICGVTFAQSQAPTFRTGTGIIEVEVTVLDTTGVPVPDLTSSEFQVFEDDVLQNIVSFSLNTVAPSPIRQSVGVANATADERVNDSHSGNTFVLLLDSGFPERVRLVASEFIESGVRPGDRVAIINRGGEVPPTLPFTSDRSEMMAQISRKAERVQPAPTISRSYGLLRDVAARLAVLPGRGKAIVFIGNGTGLLWNRRPNAIEAARETKRMFENAMRMATIANIPIHAVDPSGLTPAVSAESLIRLTSVDPRRARAPFGNWRHGTV